MQRLFFTIHIIEEATFPSPSLCHVFLEDEGFEIDLALVVQAIHAFLDGNS